MASIPTRSPSATPPTETRTNDTLAWASENVPVIAAAMANRYATSAVASFTRLSPSRIVTTRRGTPSRWKIAVAATASGGATIAPRAKAAGQPRPGMSAWATSATAAVVVRTSPTDRRPIARRFFLKSRIEVK